MRWFHVVTVAALVLGAPRAQEREERAVLRVLYVEDAPRWEYRYVKNALLRAPGVALQAFLFEASTDFRQEASEGLPPLNTLPRKRKDLFAYDVVLIGDVSPERIDRLEAPRRAWMNLLAEFVEAGGGLGFIAGDRANPDAYRGTPLEKLLPVELEPKRATGAKRAVTGAFRPHLVLPKHEISLLKSDPEMNAQLWEQGLPPLMTYYPVARAADKADVLLAHPVNRNDHGPRVIAAAAQRGKGRTFFLGTDETWRWRKPYGEKYQDQFWMNVVRYLARARSVR